MRYNSSKQHMSSFSTSHSPASWASTGSYSAHQSAPFISSYNYSSQPAAFCSSGLHYKKDGTLDLRYNSSYSAHPSAPLSSYSSYNYSSQPAAFCSSDLHYKQDGTLDRRYNSSYSALAAAFPSNHVASTPTATNDFHYKKDGTLDMRYNSIATARWLPLFSQSTRSVVLRKLALQHIVIRFTIKRMERLTCVLKVTAAIQPSLLQARRRLA